MGVAFSKGVAYSMGCRPAKRKELASDAAKWITVHPGGKGPKSNGKGNKGGTPVLIDSESGRIIGGMGGKFTGRKIGEVRKSFVGPLTPASGSSPKKTESAKKPSSGPISANMSAVSKWAGDGTLAPYQYLRQKKNELGLEKEQRREITAKMRDMKREAQEASGEDQPFIFEQRLADNVRDKLGMESSIARTIVGEPTLFYSFLGDVYGKGNEAAGLKELSKKVEPPKPARPNGVSQEHLDTLFKNGRDWRPADSTKHRMYFNVDDVLAAKGYRVERKDNGKLVDIYDPDGDRMSHNKAFQLINSNGDVYYDFEDKKYKQGNTEYKF